MRTLLALALLSLAGTGWWFTRPEPTADYEAAIERMAVVVADSASAPGSPADPAAEPTSATVPAPAPAPAAAPTLEDDLARLEELEHIVDRPALVALRQRLARALAEQPDDGRLNLALCTAGRLLGDPESAVAFGERAVTLLPESSAAQLTQAKALAELMRVKGVFSAMKHLGAYRKLIARAIELDPDNVQARVSRIGFLVFAPGILGGDLEEARRLAEELRGVDARYCGLMGALALAQEERVDEALALCETSLEQFPGDQSLHLSMARMLHEEGRVDEAAPHYDVVLAGPRTEKYYQALYYRAVLRIEAAEQLEAALADMQEYARAEPYGDFLPPVAAALWRQGQVHAALGETGRARASYEAALELDPDFEEAEASLSALD